jgi:hypothetical protein
MGQKTLAAIFAIAIIFALFVIPSSVGAQQAGTQDDNPMYYVGSFFLSLLNFPFRLATCVATQPVASVAYVGTAGVPGDYDGGTNGKQIGQAARAACAGPWLITPDQVKKDYE